jgi:hypothetical protein
LTSGFGPIVPHAATAQEETMATKQLNVAMVCLSFGFIAAVVLGLV